MMRPPVRARGERDAMAAALTAGRGIVGEPRVYPFRHLEYTSGCLTLSEDL